MPQEVPGEGTQHVSVNRCCAKAVPWAAMPVSFPHGIGHTEPWGLSKTAAGERRRSFGCFGRVPKGSLCSGFGTPKKAPNGCLWRRAVNCPLWGYQCRAQWKCDEPITRRSRDPRSPRPLMRRVVETVPVGENGARKTVLATSASLTCLLEGVMASNAAWERAPRNGLWSPQGDCAGKR